MTDLVSTLSSQSIKLRIPVEILCIDDGSILSVKTANSRIAKLANVKYRELENNIGRSAIRNKLAQEAKYDFLLFLDGDSKIIYPDFLAKYRAVLPTASVWMGGRVYESSPPKDPDLFLHWKYGRQRESKPATARAQTPYYQFMTNNFLLPKSVFFEVPLDEEVKGYGHEDTLWAFALEKRGIAICHIENPILHLGLEPSNTFLHKSFAAVQNLALIVEEGKYISTKLTRSYDLLNRYKLGALYLKIVCPMSSVFKQNLRSRMPLLLFLDLLKLCQFSKLKRSFLKSKK